MAQVPIRFVSTGHGNGVNADEVSLVLTPDSAPNKRLLKAAKKRSGGYVDVSCGRGVKSLLILQDGRVVGCSLTTETMIRRLNDLDAPKEKPEEAG